MTKVGLISDTHGLLRPEALDEMRGCNLLIHAGDIGNAEVLEALERIAPVTAVRGNNDFGAWAGAIPERAALTAGGVRILVLHDLSELGQARGYGVVVTGHSHQPKAERRDGILYINPGSAGPRRFRLPISVGRLTIAGGTIEHELISL
jgi:putative phosphoesterase